MILRDVIIDLFSRSEGLRDLVYVRIEDRVKPDAEPVTIPVARIDAVGNICLDRQAVVNALAKRG